MADKRIISYHLSRLQDKNRDTRLKAIHELGLLGDPDTLEALQEIFNSDPDPDIRKAAQEAGRAIFVKKREQSA